MTILILSNKWDISVDYVVKTLRERNVKYFRLNTENLIDLNSTLTITPFSYIVRGSQTIDFHDVSSILLRRPGKPFDFVSKNEKPSPAITNFVTDQWNAFLSGLQSFANIVWVNHPQKNTFAESKINQLIAAKKLGLPIPKTCITSSKTMLSKFWKECNNKIIAKALYAPLIREFDKEYFIFSNRITHFDEIQSNNLSLSPTIFQEEITQKTDYRLTVIGNDSHCIKIKTSNRSILDWRTIKDKISYEKTDLPKEIIDKCINLVRSFGLVFGAIDLVESNGDYYFLEINPNGEWGWLQKNANLPIAETLVDYLSGVKTFG